MEFPFVVVMKFLNEINSITLFDYITTDFVCESERGALVLIFMDCALLECLIGALSV